MSNKFSMFIGQFFRKYVGSVDGVTDYSFKTGSMFINGLRVMNVDVTSDNKWYISFDTETHADSISNDRQKFVFDRNQLKEADNQNGSTAYLVRADDGFHRVVFTEDVTHSAMYTLTEQLWEYD